MFETLFVKKLFEYSSFYILILHTMMNALNECKMGLRLFYETLLSIMMGKFCVVISFAITLKLATIY